MRITVNPEATSGGFDYVEAGQQKLRVVKVEQKPGKKAPYIKWEFELCDPNVKGVNGGKPCHIFENTSLQADAQFSLRGIVEGLGLKWEDFDTDDAVGLELTAVLKIRDYEGVLSNEIARVIPLKK